MSLHKSSDVEILTEIPRQEKPRGAVAIALKGSLPAVLRTGIVGNRGQSAGRYRSQRRTAIAATPPQRTSGSTYAAGSSGPSATTRRGAPVV